MNSTDYKICDHVITSISSKKYENIFNYLFLEPVDLTHFPTYTSIVKRPMDLGTVKRNLQNGNVYKTRQEFLNDTNTCFENAELFHKDKPDTRWIIDVALKMKKNVKKEMKNALKMFGNGGVGIGAGGRNTPTTGDGDTTSNAPTKTKPKLSISLKNLGRSSNKSPSDGLSDSSAITPNERKKKKKSNLADNSGISDANNNSTPKPRLSIKRNNNDSANPPSIQETKSAKPKLKLKLGLSKKTPGNKSGTPKSSTPKATTPKSTILKTTTTTTTPKATSSTTITTENSSSQSSSSSSKPTVNKTNTTTTTTTTTPSSTKSTKSSKPTSTPKSTASGPSRGKELPSAIAAAKANAKKESKKESAKKRKTPTPPPSSATTTTSISNKKSTTPTTAIPATTSTTITMKKDQQRNKANKSNTPKVKIGSMIPICKAQCSKVLSALKQRQKQEEIGWFVKPVNFKAIPDYHQKVPNPMDLSTITTKLDKNAYSTVADFVLDLRRIFANCLRYNILSSKDELRCIARNMVITTEQYLHLFIASALLNNSSIKTTSATYPKLLYCWKTCLEIIDAILDLRNPDDKLQTVHYFLFPASFFFGGKLSPKYKDKVKSPMDFGTITSNLIEGTYQSVDAFVHDCKLVTANCKAFYQGEENGGNFIAQATRLEDFMLNKLDSLIQYDRSEKGLEARKLAMNPTVVTLLKPPNVFYTSMLEELRSTSYTDKYTKLTEPAAQSFEHSVDTNVFKDYLQYVQTPMDLKRVENKIFLGTYQLPEDFEYDINLIFKNCEAYNIPKANNHIVNLSKHCARVFRKMYAARMKAFETSGGKNTLGEPKKEKKRPAETQTPTVVAPASKRIKIEAPTARRKSPTFPTQTSRPPNSKGKTPKSQGGGKRVLPRIIIRNDGPLPLHVAIAKIKEGFTRRRQHKELQDWEGACSRFFRELKRHPWISTSKRFVFDAPVPMLHPEIKEAYTMLIEKPMDLTTAEGKLLQGGLYKEPQEFVDDIALVFANAVTFNKSGHDQGDPTSMAYFEASSHLLRYARWLSLEHFSPFLIDDSHSEGIRQSGPLPHWKLTVSNQNDARYEMEKVVISSSIDKSDEGDRYTWYEVECEKLLKSLRHQSDHKKMTYFLNKNMFPPDYVAIISKPIEWETCNSKLQQRQYDTFGDIINDLRLIFTNAVKYNGRVKDTDPTSKLAYDSAIYMSGKLEVAIQRLFITAADRIEREKVEEIILDREAVINQREEEERLRAEWQNQRDQARQSNDGRGRSGLTPSVKIIQRRPARRDLDFDNPFNDQDNSYEQSEMDALNKQKIMYEKQQKDRMNMHLVAKNVGIRVLHNLFWRSQAVHWAKDMSERIQDSLSQDRNLQLAAEQREKEKQAGNTNGDSAPKASIVASLLGDTSRSQVKMELTKVKQSKKKKRKRLFLE